mmetsp:Transcript_40057/g.84111  ORF Transcript_40057/g.84111 Transcript_40057/m.84111 type:complete len:407 (-) Transcript_40057:248-1468(-)|eukprot:CAMPEP_0183740072 /NCGR_PEP_ID=MMETSP0737-20130205/58760_1 /TAXON_ID=385413 /ORGANISM="Thalassiosira miniscula, Strain CCMP1093" /LENGTH=406 /DNA_ID=CAMNT_0025975057 /DNA_START=65 /DNA_END=1285 /DNA_ORIENTATION=+
MVNSCGERPPPLKIVLGAFNGSSSNSENDAGHNFSASAAAPKELPSSQSSSSPATYILGTSYFATPRLGGSGGRRSVMKLNKDGRVPGEDRKGPFDHFKPKSLILSTTRVTAINISTTLSTFFSDQLKSEQRVEEMVESGEITEREADAMNEEWENREWKLRQDALPKKIGWALLRFHACTALMRFYEYLMARYVLQLEGGGGGTPLLLEGPSYNATTHSRGGDHEQAMIVMDKLTRDPYQASLRTSQLLHNQEHSPGMVISSDGKETSTNRELVKRMFGTCMWANIIPFVAELTVQQLVLVYGYGVYYMAKEKRKRERKERKDGEDIGECKEDSSEAQEESSDGAVSESAYLLSLMIRSSRLTIARSFSWITASAGGAMGSIVLPGWGTVFGIQIGDTLVGALVE